MQVRLTTALGMSVREEETGEEVGTLSGILVHPDTGKIEGFFVAIQGFMQHEQLFLSVLDIRFWGLYVRILDRDALSDLEDRVRLQPLLEDPRTVLGQRMRTESGVQLGRCADVQFDTQFFQVEWLFPRRLWRWKSPVPISEVLEVRPDAIVIRDPARPLTEPVRQTAEPMLKVPDVA